MLKKTITYEDFNGEQVTEDFYFNLTKAELIELELSKPGGGLAEHMVRVTKSGDGGQILAEFKKIVLMAYGVKSDDGKKFIKSQELRDEFAASEPFSELIVEICTNADAASAFVNGVVPRNLEAQVDSLVKRAAGQEELQYGTPRLGEQEKSPEERARESLHTPTGPGIVVDDQTGDVTTVPSNPKPIKLTAGEVARMDKDELVSGLQTGKYVLPE